uniref:Large ribosomal subunit protein uL4c n=1 Tax=Bostrychia moritziana TaxID=103713 RepID=A0A1Z1M6X2_BOSMO|nr:ribosomal protein L4 [Bostrychia moritziana]ARW61700.1 ribosomal protein L4 [Bostrychia moritziana]
MTITQRLIYPIIKHKQNEKIVSKEDLYLEINQAKSEQQQIYITHRALRQQLTNNRIRNAHTKTRSEVRGGGKKPWKQKGTGKARAGSTRSPLWKGGGTIFGPKKKVYKCKINKKERILAIQTVINNKFSKTFIIDKLLNNANRPSTKNAISELHTLGIETNKKTKILLIVDKQNHILYLSLRNISNITIIEAQNINILSLIKNEIIVITKKGFTELKKIYY